MGWSVFAITALYLPVRSGHSIARVVGCAQNATVQCVLTFVRDAGRLEDSPVLVRTGRQEQYRHISTNVKQVIMWPVNILIKNKIEYISPASLQVSLSAFIVSFPVVNL